MVGTVGTMTINTRSVSALFSSMAFVAAAVGAQPAAPGGQPSAPPPARTVLTVTSSAWPDGGEIPMRHAARGENRSPAFEFRWMTGNAPAQRPAEVQSYAVIFHDIENAPNKGVADTLHWTLFNIPGTAAGLAEGLGAGDLPDGSRNGPGINARNGNPGSYFGPGAPVGPFHHYVFEFYALDTTLSLPGTATRDELLKAMEGHVVGKAAYTGRFRTPAP